MTRSVKPKTAASSTTWGKPKDKQPTFTYVCAFQNLHNVQRHLFQFSPAPQAVRLVINREENETHF